MVELLLEQRVQTPGFWLPVSALTASDRGLWGVYVVNAENLIERRLVEVIHNEASRAFVRGLLLRQRTCGEQWCTTHSGRGKVFCR